MTNRLIPCPFCGREQHNPLEAGHADDCYFTLEARLKRDMEESDNYSVPDLLAAWNRRALPEKPPTQAPAVGDLKQAMGEFIDSKPSIDPVRSPYVEPLETQAAEFCWLVELFLGDGTGNSLGWYHTGFTDISGNSRSTQDPLKAKRYSTWREANLVSVKLGHTLQGTWRAVQHGFVSQPPVQGSQP